MVHALQGNQVAGEPPQALPRRLHSGGFTLMELSIVLVIIGLIVGSIVVGKELIRTSELNSILKDLDQYNAAVLTFKDKYGGLPGDMPNATTFWGAAWGSSTDNYTTTCFNNSANTPVGSRLTCNGNGDGMISGGIYSGDGVTPCSNNTYIYAFGCDKEQYAVWQHLANAGLDAGLYVPAQKGSVTLSFRPYWVRGTGGNIPSSKSGSGDGFMLSYVCGVTDYIAWSTACGHFFFYGTQTQTVQNSVYDMPFWPALTVAEARGIDLKVDDGKPGTGKVLSSKYSWTPLIPSANCATNAPASTAVYDNSQTGKQCGLMFKAQF